MEKILHLLRLDQPRRSLGRKKRPWAGKPEAFRYVLRQSRNFRLTVLDSSLLIIAAPGQLTLCRCVLDDQGNFIDVLFVISEKGDMLNALSAMWSRTSFRRNAVL
jgi:hypothetical protein